MNRRTMTKTLLAGVAVGALGSRAATAQRPAASPAASGDIRLVDLAGIALALSPDGTMVAGLSDRDVFCVWDVETFEPIAQSDPIPELRIIDDASVVWSPDSSAVAWSLQAARLMRDGDIYTFDLTSGTITNLTDEGGSEDAPSLLEAQGTPSARFTVDMFPGWSADGSEILFTRSPWGDDTPRETRLMRVSRDGGEASEIALLSNTNALLVSGPVFPLDDGSVLYGTWPPGLENPEQGIFMVTPDGKVEGISTGMLASGLPAMKLISVAPQVREASAVSLHNYGLFNPDNPTWVEIALDTGIPTPFQEVLSLPMGADAIEQDLVLFAAPAFLIRDDEQLDGYIYATADAQYDAFTLWRHDLASGGSNAIGTVERRDTDGPGVLLEPRVTITNAGTAALLFGGSIWIADLG